MGRLPGDGSRGRGVVRFNSTQVSGEARRRRRRRGRRGSAGSSRCVEHTRRGRPRRTPARGRGPRGSPCSRPIRRRRACRRGTRATPRPIRSGRRAPGSCSRSRRGWRRARPDIRRPNSATSPRLQGLGPSQDALVLGHDVPGPLPADRVELGPSARRRSSSERSRSCSTSSPIAIAEVGDDPLALLAAAVVHPVGQASRGPASRRRRSPARGCPEAGGSYSGVRQSSISGMVRPADQDGELIEQPRVDADVLVLGPLQVAGQVHPPGVVEVGPPPRHPASSGRPPAPPGGSPSWRAPRRAARRR